MTKEKIRNIFIYILLIYTALVAAFYFIAEDQLKYKNSAGNISILDSDTVTEELVLGKTYNQDFYNNIDNIEQISIFFTRYYRTGGGDIIVEMLDRDRVLFSKTLDVDSIQEMQRVYITPSRMISGLKGKTLTLRVHSVNADNSGVAILMNKSVVGSYIKVNTQLLEGSLCYTVSGTDNIMAYEYYWYIVGIAGLLLCLLLFWSYRCFINNRYNIINAALNAVDRYGFLIKQLVSRDFKTKYKRSLLGMLWSFLNPLLTMLVQFFVFSSFFSADTKNYPVYLLTGVICFNFFKEVTDMSLTSITGNGTLINKVYVPKYIFPLARTISSTINLGLSLIPLLLVSLVLGAGLHKTLFLMFYFLACLVVFSLGIGMFLACIMVFFRDTQFLWGVLSQIWMYATPIFYSAEIVPERYRFILRFNPLYHFIGNIRKCLIDGVSPEPLYYIVCLVFALLSFFIGSFVFKKNQDKFTLYL